MPFSSRASTRQASSSFMRRRAAEREDEPDAADIEAVDGWVGWFWGANTACPVRGGVGIARRRRGLVLNTAHPVRRGDGESFVRCPRLVGWTKWAGRESMGFVVDVKVGVELQVGPPVRGCRPHHRAP